MKTAGLLALTWVPFLIALAWALAFRPTKEKENDGD